MTTSSLSALTVGSTFHFPKGKRTYELVELEAGNSAAYYVNPTKDAEVIYDCSWDHNVVVGEFKSAPKGASKGKKTQKARRASTGSKGAPKKTQRVSAEPASSLVERVDAMEAKLDAIMSILAESSKKTF
jgi:hypothetical protein